MRKARFFTTVVVSLATLGLCAPSAAFAGDSSPKAKAVDVALMEGGVLVGQVVNSQGTGLENTAVSLQYEGRNLATPQTAKDGYFALKGLRPGVYHLEVAQTQGAYRLWAPNTAPPTASKGALIVTGDGVARGQIGRGGLRALFANPWVIGAIVATAVAVPVAVHNSGSDSPQSP